MKRIFLLLSFFLFFGCAHLQIPTNQDFKKLSTFDIEYDYKTVYEATKIWLKKSPFKTIESENMNTGYIKSTNGTITSIPGFFKPKNITGYAEISISSITSNKTNVRVEIIYDNYKINKRDLEKQSKIIKDSIGTNINIMNGDLVIIIQTKYDFDYVNINMSMGNDSVAIQVKNHFVKIFPKEIFTEMLQPALNDYKKLKTKQEKELFKYKFYTKLMPNVFVSIIAQNQTQDSTIEGAIYFYGERISHDFSNINYGVIKLNADIAKYMIETLDK